MTRSKAAPPAQRRPANLSNASISAAIPQLELRLKELEDFKIDTLSATSNPELAGLEHAVETTIARIFGVDTIEYDRLHSPFFDSRFGYGNLPRLRQYVGDDQRKAIALFRQQIALMKEQLGEEGGNAADRAIRAYGNLDLHPDISRAASDLYRGGHCANAIEDAVKALNALVRLRSGKELDGAPLMQTVFSPKNPVLRFNELKDQSDQDEQHGFMMMFAGAVAGLRNPRAHRLMKDDPERALEFIAFVSLLAKLLDGTKKVL